MTKTREQDAGSLRSLIGARRRVVKLEEDLVDLGRLDDGGDLPLLVTPRAGGVDLAAWLRSHQELVEEKLLQHGGVLFRGFDVDTAEQFEELARVTATRQGLVNYVEGSSPRIMVTDKVYTSTEYPPEFFVSMHNELSYAHRWPSKIFFYCLVEPSEGGETPIADSRRVLTALPPEVKEKFERLGVRYLRNLHGGRGAGLSWQTVFETDDRAEVERYCREGGIRFSWKEDGGLRTEQLRPAIVRHPKSGDLLWFNQADQFHPSNLGAEIAASLLATTAPEDLPINATYGDGSPIEDEVLDQVREAFRSCLVTFPWRRGDVLVLDNMLVAHGRMPFRPPRRVVVTMGDPVSLAETPVPQGGDGLSWVRAAGAAAHAASERTA